VTLRALCHAAGITRQAYYQERQRRAWEAVRDERVLSLVRLIRCRHPKMGTRKLLELLRPHLEQDGLRIGRDQLFALLGRKDLLVQRERQPRRTTWSGTVRLPNRVAGLTITRRDQVWVTDITYIPLPRERFAYWFVVMDLFSRAILGEVMAPSLEARHALAAIQQAAQHAGGSLRHLIHHSDHGVQYTSGDYQTWLRAHGILASMGEVGNSYDNAYAERVIGILKQEYGLGRTFIDEAQARYAATEGVYLYNHERPHQALAYACPMAVYTGRATAEAFTVYEHDPADAVPVGDLSSE
jgi:transposase InsO family protein